MQTECAARPVDSPLRIRTTRRSRFSTRPMTRHSARTAQIFGAILIILISAWDMDAMRPHIAAHSWATLAFVSLYLVVHVSNYVTVGRLVHHLDPLILTNPLAFADTGSMPLPALAIEERMPPQRAFATAAHAATQTAA